MVISYKMNESEMGNRGSKSENFIHPKVTSVKEQRVDGSWSNLTLSKSLLRCTLMDRGICYQIKIPTKQLNNRIFSTLTSQPEINPWVLIISGFSDAESSFFISIYNDEN